MITGNELGKKKVFVSSFGREWYWGKIALERPERRMLM